MPSHRVVRVLPYAAEELFDLAADVERYPEFVPWWVAARVVRRERQSYETDQVVRVGVFRQRFRSRTVLRRPQRIEVTSSDRAFRRFELTWTFDPLPGGGCEVGLAMTFELHSRVAQELAAMLLASAPERLVSAFEERARRLHGAAG